MSVWQWSEMTWEEARDRVRPGAVAILPLGAVEAHGPQLALATDLVIAEAMARSGAERLAARGLEVFMLPSIPYAAAPFASAFPGTISVAAATIASLIVEISRSLAAQGIHRVAIANAHLDPAHLGCIRTAVAEVRGDEGGAASMQGGAAIIFPDLTARPLALRLGDEFRSGACHAGRFESSIVMAARPDLVRDAVRHGLPAVEASLSRAIRDGKTDFASAGGPRAYFGAPAAASVEEGERTIAILGEILAEAVMGDVPRD